MLGRLVGEYQWCCQFKHSRYLMSGVLRIMTRQEMNARGSSTFSPHAYEMKLEIRAYRHVGTGIFGKEF